MRDGEGTVPRGVLDNPRVRGVRANKKKQTEVDGRGRRKCPGNGDREITQGLENITKAHRADCPT